jgi:hypothetical protein
MAMLASKVPILAELLQQYYEQSHRVAYSRQTQVHHNRIYSVVAYSLP